MKTIRIIPRIDVKGPNVVKGIHLEGLRVLGSPNSFSKYYYSQGADEIVYMDVVASLYERNSLLDVVKKTAEDVFIPITVGGGIRSIGDVQEILRFGADKVCVNTTVIKDKSLISRVANEFGSSTIVVAIEAIRQSDGRYLAFIDNGREFTGKEVVEWAIEVERLGAGEIMITSVDREGTGKGMDINLINSVSDEVNIPVIAHGGAGKVQDIMDVALQTSANAVSLASVIHYDAIKYIEDEKTENEGNRHFLSMKKSVSHIESCAIGEIKKKMLDCGIEVRA